MSDLNTLFDAYNITIYAFGAVALLMLVQLLVADVLGIRSRHVPGTPIEADHDNLLFRAARTVANTNESIAIFILLALFCMLSGGSPTYCAIGAWGYVAARGVYAACYYLNLQTLRSIAFGISLLFLFSLLVAGVLR